MRTTYVVRIYAHAYALEKEQANIKFSHSTKTQPAFSPSLLNPSRAIRIFALPSLVLTIDPFRVTVSLIFCGSLTALHA